MLERLSLNYDFAPLPPALRNLADEAEEMEAGFKEGAARISTFEPSNARTAYGHIRAVREQTDDPGLTFCEYGSGLGVVSCLAASLGWKTTGLEIETPLLAKARGLAQRHGHDVTYFNASYKPDGFFTGDVLRASLETAHGFGLMDFDVIYVYAWPAELRAVTDFFSDFAKPGTLLLIYEGGETFSVMRAMPPIH